MTSDDVFDALFDQVAADTTLAGYIQKNYKGLRNNITDHQKPCLIFEIREDGEVQQFLSERVQNVSQVIEVIGMIFCLDQDVQIQGNAAYKGVLDLANDIRKAIDDDPKLGNPNSIIDTSYDKAEFDVTYTKTYPYRTVMIPVTVLYRQTSNA